MIVEAPVAYNQVGQREREREREALVAYNYVAHTRARTRTRFGYCERAAHTTRCAVHCADTTGVPRCRCLQRAAGVCRCLLRAVSAESRAVGVC